MKVLRPWAGSGDANGSAGSGNGILRQRLHQGYAKKLHAMGFAGIFTQSVYCEPSDCPSSVGLLCVRFVCGLNDEEFCLAPPAPSAKLREAECASLRR